MEPGRVVIRDDNVAARGRGGDLALGGVDEWAESGEDLNVILSGIVDLYIAPAQLDLRHGGNSG